MSESFRVAMTEDQAEAVLIAAHEQADVDGSTTKDLINLALSFWVSRKDNRKWRMEDE